MDSLPVLPGGTVARNVALITTVPVAEGCILVVLRMQVSFRCAVSIIGTGSIVARIACTTFTLTYRV